MSIVHFNRRNNYQITKEEFEIFRKQTINQYIDEVNRVLSNNYDKLLEVKNKSRFTQYNLVINILDENNIDTELNIHTTSGFLYYQEYFSKSENDVYDKNQNQYDLTLNIMMLFSVNLEINEIKDENKNNILSLTSKTCYNKFILFVNDDLNRRFIFPIYGFLNTPFEIIIRSELRKPNDTAFWENYKSFELYDKNCFKLLKEYKFFDDYDNIPFINDIENPQDYYDCSEDKRNKLRLIDFDDYKYLLFKFFYHLNKTFKNEKLSLNEILNSIKFYGSYGSVGDTKKLSLIYDFQPISDWQSKNFIIKFNEYVIYIYENIDDWKFDTYENEKDNENMIYIFKEYLKKFNFLKS